MNPQVYTTQEGIGEIKNNPQVCTTQEGTREIKNESLGIHYPQVYTTQEGIGEIIDFVCQDAKQYIMEFCSKRFSWLVS